jgi:hypothetical protein
MIENDNIIGGRRRPELAAHTIEGKRDERNWEEEENVRGRRYHVGEILGETLTTGLTRNRSWCLLIMPICCLKITLIVFQIIQICFS